MNKPKEKKSGVVTAYSKEPYRFATTDGFIYEITSEGVEIPIRYSAELIAAGIEVLKD